MKIFFKAYLASLMAGVTFIFLIFLSLLFLPKEEKILVRENSILHLKIDAPIVENAVNDPLENFNFMSLSGESNIGLNDLKEALKHAKNDDKIKGVFLDFSLMQGGLSTLKEFRDAILDFKSSGKFVYSYAEFYTQGAYYVASAADSVFFNPSGFMEFVGMASSRPYLKGLFDKIGVEPVVVRGSNNKFKSAVEPYLSTEMSDANRLQLEELLGDLWSGVISEIGESRDISTQNLQSLVDSIGLFTPQLAQKSNLIDAMAFRSDIEERFLKITDAKSRKRLPLISLNKYVQATSSMKNKSENEIAIIYAQGEIVMNEGEALSIAPILYSNAIQKAAEDDDVKAIVIRVNSPGGSALTSDILHHEIEKALEKKPVVVSMGDYAASGGYFISAPASKIVAQPNTITGSIGVFMMTFTAKELINEKANVKFHTVKTGEMADFGNLARDMTEHEYKVLQKSVDATYGKFIQKVKNGRGIDSLYVDSIGQGRVWSGKKALELGLVDELGGLDRALEIAAELAEIEDYEILELPKHEDTFEKLLKELSGQNVKDEFLREELGDLYPAYQSIKKMRENKGMMARMPYYIEIK